MGVLVIAPCTAKEQTILLPFNSIKLPRLFGTLNVSEGTKVVGHCKLKSFLHNGICGRERAEIPETATILSAYAGPYMLGSIAASCNTS